MVCRRGEQCNGNRSRLRVLEVTVPPVAWAHEHQLYRYTVGTGPSPVVSADELCVTCRDEINDKRYVEETLRVFGCTEVEL